MLDAISDFWKPSRKTPDNGSIDPSGIKPGSVIGFGFIPQSEISGKRLPVSAINTYVFDGDQMTSFVLKPESDVSISLIIADSEQEKYIALSRRIPFAERAQLFENNELLACMGGDDNKRLQLKKNDSWSAWTASEYKKAINGLKGKLITGDYRNFSALPGDVDAKEFTYTLLVSNNSEYALEIEQYQDNKIEVYATVYRRLSDIGEITNASAQAPAAAPLAEAPKPKTLAKTAGDLAALKPANDSSANKQEATKLVEATAPTPAKQTNGLVAETAKMLAKSGPANPPPAAAAMPEQKPEKAQTPEKPAALPAETPSTQIAEKNMPAATISAMPALSSTQEAADKVLASLPQEFEPVKQAVPSLAEAYKELAAKETSSQPAAPATATAPQATQTPTVSAAAPAATESSVAPAASAAAPASEFTTPSTTPVTTQKEQPMATFNGNFQANPAGTASDPFQARAIQPKAPDVEADTVECELPVANRVIEEAIRNEMSMSDIIRRIIALPVARQESVSIPVMLTDSDYSLLAVRYGIPAADRAAIKAKIIEEIGDFSGSTRQ